MERRCDKCGHFLESAGREFVFMGVEVIWDGYCTRFPKWEKVSNNKYCGEYSPKGGK